MNRYFGMAAIVALCVATSCFTASAGEMAVQGGAPVQASAGQTTDDPFAELLKNNPSEVIKTGPTCRFIKIQLPPGVHPEDIPGY